MVQWLRLWASTAEGMGLIPSQGSKILHAAQGEKKVFVFMKIFYLLIRCELGQQPAAVETPFL